MKGLNLISLFLSLLLIVVKSALAIETVGEPKLANLTLAGPPAAVTYPLLRMIDANALEDIAEQVEFKLWKSPDQMRALTLRGKVDIMASPTNVAATLYNKGVDLKLLNVSTWGLLWILSRDSQIKTLADLKGEEIAVPFRGDMPDIVFNNTAKAQGLTASKDFKVRYVATPMDAMQLLIMRRVDHALLAEPAASMAMNKTQSLPVSLVAPDLYRAIDLQQQWGQAHKTAARIPQAGILQLNNQLSAQVIERIQQAHQKALQWCLDNPKLAGELAAKYIPMLEANAVADSIATAKLMHKTAQESQVELAFFFDVLHQSNPALIGGKLPAEGFYFKSH